jgi:hypothetical protein
MLHEGLRSAHAPMPLAHAKLQRFSQILITDSTHIGLPATLTPVFKGCAGSATLKLHVTLDYLPCGIDRVQVTPGNPPDQNAPQLVAQALPHRLNLFDLGYFKQDWLQALDQQEAYFVTQYQRQTA